MKFYIHHIYLLLAIVALIVCMCSPALITFVYHDMSSVSINNFALHTASLATTDIVSSAASCALGVCLLLLLWLALSLCLLACSKIFRCKSVVRFSAVAFWLDIILCCWCWYSSFAEILVWLISTGSCVFLWWRSSSQP